MPPVIVINPTNFNKMIIIAGPVQLTSEHINSLMNRQGKKIEDFIQDTALVLLEYDVEIAAKNQQGKLPTAWEFTYKIHVNELNAQKFWESYLKKNSILIFSTCIRSYLQAN